MKSKILLQKNCMVSEDGTTSMIGIRAVSIIVADKYGSTTPKGIFTTTSRFFK